MQPPYPSQNKCKHLIATVYFIYYKSFQNFGHDYLSLDKQKNVSIKPQESVQMLIVWKKRVKRRLTKVSTHNACFFSVKFVRRENCSDSISPQRVKPHIFSQLVLWCFVYFVQEDLIWNDYGNQYRFHLDGYKIVY